MDNYEKLSKHLSEYHSEILKEEFNIYDLDFIKSTLEKILVDVNNMISKLKINYGILSTRFLEV